MTKKEENNSKEDSPAILEKDQAEGKAGSSDSPNASSQAPSPDLEKKKAHHKSAPQSKKKGKGKNEVKIHIGRRKTSTARVRLVSGKGQLIINKKKLEEYFPILQLQQTIKKSLVTLKKDKDYDVFVNVKGGGFRGQADAISLAIARGLIQEDELLKKKLRSNGLLTRDSRMVERKKYGLHKARRAPQFSKR